MESTPQFRADLYRGTAHYYDRYRVPYPAQLVDDLVTRASLSGTGRLLDLACGPGRVTFALSEHFADVVAIDQEEESISYAKALAGERGAAHIKWRTGRAENLDVEGPFELVTVRVPPPRPPPHRRPREPVAPAHRTYRPTLDVNALAGACQLAEDRHGVGGHWMQVTGSVQNIPSNLADTVTQEPHLTVLARAGLTVIGTYEFTAPQTWTLETLTGFAHSTSILSRAALGGHVEAFERDRRDRLLAIQPNGNFEETVNFSYDLAVKP